MASLESLKGVTELNSEEKTIERKSRGVNFLIIQNCNYSYLYELQVL
jgi:hypothetical protein